MIKKLLACIFLAGAAHLVEAQGTLNRARCVDYVEVLSGTAPSTSAAAMVHSEVGSERSGNTIPAVGLPFAMTQFTPQTNQYEQKCLPPYEYKAKKFKGFRASHWLSGSCTQDYGSISILPVVGTLSDSSGLLLNHENESATPYEYQIGFPKKYVAKMTATLRSAIWEITMLTADTLHLIIRTNSDFNQGRILTKTDHHVITGFNPAHRIYQGWGEYAGFDGNFYLHSEKAPIKIQREKTKSGVVDSGTVVLSYYLQVGETLKLKMGTSFTSIQEAKNNLQTEIPDWSYQKIKQTAIQNWETHLGRIQVYTKNERDLKIFYTSLYHAFQHPRLFSDISGTYPAFDRRQQSAIKYIRKGSYYGDFSMWDIYRAQLPLMMLIEPQLIGDFARSILLKSRQGGWVPIFPCWNNYTAAMIGDHATPFIAAAYNFGIRDYAIKELYSYLRKNAFDTTDKLAYSLGKGRRALKSYLQHGYIPLEDEVKDAFHKKEQVSRTLEYAYDDYALSRLAKALGYKADYEVLSKRAMNYKNVIDPKVGMARGRFLSGKWVKIFTPYQRASYITEGTPAQYTFYVPQDIRGLSAFIGGPKMLEKGLDSLFAKQGYWHGNEPGHQIPFMYNYTASPYKTQREVRKILREAYGDGPGGVDGNDDAGQMSAWYIFASMGFYPLDPVSGTFMLASPIFDSISLQLGNGRFLSIRVTKSSDTACYLDHVKLNGMPYHNNYLSHEIFDRGGCLQIWLTDHPTSWGSQAKDRGPSLSDN